jgi:hypothetical protein
LEKENPTALNHNPKLVHDDAASKNTCTKYKIEQHKLKNKAEQLRLAKDTLHTYHCILRSNQAGCMFFPYAE